MRVVLFGMCAVLALGLSTEARAANEDVVQMLTAFYKWYIPHLDQKPGTKSDHKMSDFATDGLLAQIDRLREPEEEGGVAKLDWDPFINAQDYDEEWGTKVRVDDVQVSGDNATATVHLGEKQPSTVRLILIRDAGRWKINNFIPKL